MNGSRITLLLIVLLLVIAGMVLFAAIPRLAPQTEQDTPAPQQEQPRPQDPTPQPPADAPLSARVSVDSPKEGATVSHAFTVSGRAPGPWYFEANFPIIITDAEGAKIGTAHATAQGEWMTEALVPFTAQIDVGDYKGRITVNLLRDNPSGLPENDDSKSFDLLVQ